MKNLYAYYLIMHSVISDQYFAVIKLSVLSDSKMLINVISMEYSIQFQTALGSLYHHQSIPKDNPL